MHLRISHGIKALAIVLVVAFLTGSSFAQDSSHSSATVANSPGGIATKKSAATQPQDTPLMERALEESYSVGKEFQPEDRILHLMELCTITTEVSALRAKEREWTEELFRVAGEFPAGDALRTRGQSAAVVTMSSLDTKRALQMFDALEPPAKADTDPRAWVARAAFSKILEQQGLKAVPTLRMRARKLGETGPYPYSAMTPVIAKLKDQPEKAQQIFHDALGYFRQSKDPLSSDMNFVSFLRGVHGLNIIPDWLMHEAAEELANHVLHAADSAPDPDPAAGFDRSQFFFRSALSVLQSIDPEIANNLKAQEPSLARRARVNGMSSRNSQSSTSQATFRNDPEFAKLEAHNSELLNNIMSMSEDGQQNSPEIREAIAAALDGGLRQTQRAIEIAPEQAHALKRSPPSLAGIIRTASQIAPGFAMQQIETIQDSELKAYLLLEFAGGVQELHYFHEMETTREAAPPPKDDKSK